MPGAAPSVEGVGVDPKIINGLAVMCYLREMQRYIGRHILDHMTMEVVGGGGGRWGWVGHNL